MTVSCIISEIKQAIGRKSLFLYPLHVTPPLGGDPSQNIAILFRAEKTRIAWLADSVISLICLAISIEYRHVMHRQAYKWTSCDSIVCAMRSSVR